MSADPEEECQDLQCDSSSSSGSGSESPQDETTIARPNSPSSVVDGRNEENPQVAQIAEPQDPQISSQSIIEGGEFSGAHIGPKTTSQQQTNFIESVDQSKQVHIHYHLPPGSSEQATSSQEPVGAVGHTPHLVALGSSIKIINRHPNSEHIFFGEQTRRLGGNRKLAIKLLQNKEENRREAKILSELPPHHNVVNAIDCDTYILGDTSISGISNNLGIYIAMELCHEHNLHDHVMYNNNNNVPFDPRLSISQAKQLVEGLNHIHDNDIIHRDLKPHNILFSLDKKTLKIADFGISVVMDGGGSIRNDPKARVGTDGYRAPEIYNSGEISKRADTFSLGLVIYFLWSNGHHAFGEDPDDWNSNIKKNRDRDFSKIHHILGDQGITLLESMLQNDPEARPTVDQILISHRIFDGTFRIDMQLGRTPGSRKRGARDEEPSSSSSACGGTQEKKFLKS